MRISVLIADDHTIVRDGLRAMLSTDPDISVVGGAASGRMAVSQAQQYHPDVVIIDISMPELSGIDAARQILRTAPHTGVIVLSMSGSAEDIFRALQAGARGYLLKESAVREVSEAIRAVHAGGYYFSQPVIQTLVADYLLHRQQAAIDDPLQLLSTRERDVLRWVVQGKTSAEIAEILYLSPKTVETYRGRMMHKLGLPDMPSLIRFALQKGLIE